MTNVKRMSRSVSIPSRLAVTVSSATARSALPVRVAFISTVSTASTTIDTPKMIDLHRAHQDRLRADAEVDRARQVPERIGRVRVRLGAEQVLDDVHQRHRDARGSTPA